jgi:hypothetical protein
MRSPAAVSRGAVAAVGAMLAIALLWPLRADAAVPVAKATWAAEVNASSFRAWGVIDTGNLNTTYRFDYVSEADFAANLAAGRDGFSGALHIPIGAEAKVLASTVDQEVGQRIGGLAAETAYRFRLVAKNGAGEDDGPVRRVTTQEAVAVFALPENRGWEMVSPVEKNGGQIAAPGKLFGGGDFQGAVQGGAVTYGSASSFAGAVGAPGGSQYVSARTAGGWSTTNVTLPSAADAFGPEPDGVPYRLFSADLEKAVALNAPHSFQLLAMSPTPNLIAGLAAPDLRLVGATEDLSSVVFATCAALTADATEVPAPGGGCDPTFPNLYLDQAGTLRLLNVEPGESTGTPGASLAAQRGATSDDGSRAYWIDSTGALILRDGSRSLLVDPEGSFQAASSGGEIAFFTKASHLYRYSLASESSTDLTPGGGVEGVLGASTSGSHVYYLDGSGVHLWHAGATTSVAANAASSNFPPATGTARVTADGTRLTFLSDAPLTDYDPEGATEVYWYDAQVDSLLCVSCNPYGAKPLGSASIPGALANGTEVAAYKPRAMDSNGNRVFFDSHDALVPLDSNGEQDVYEWRANGVGGCAKATGCVNLISSGKGSEDSRFIDSSLDATDVFFLAVDSLVATDPGSQDLYDARIGGGFPQPPSPTPCFGDACQPLPPEPDDPTPGTLFYGSEANPDLKIENLKKKAKHKGRKKHRKKRHNKNGGKGRDHQHRRATR